MVTQPNSLDVVIQAPAVPRKRGGPRVILSEMQVARCRYIRTVLAWHGHTQTDLGKLLGCSQEAAGRKLRAQRRFTDDELLTIAEAYDLDPGYLLRPPPLEDILGAPVRHQGGDLLTCTFNAFPQVRALGKRPLTQISLADGTRAA